MPSRIQQINPNVLSEALAIRTHINVNWLATLGGQLSGDIIFENQRFLQDVGTGQYFAADGSAPEYSLTRPLQDAMAFAIPLPEPTSVLTGAHVVAFIKAYHSVRYEEQFNPPEPEPVHEPTPESTPEPQPIPIGSTPPEPEP